MRRVASLVFVTTCLQQLLMLQANAQGELVSCENTRATFGDLFPSSLFPSSRPLAGSLCQLSSTCCSHALEEVVKRTQTAHYEERISQLSSDLATCQDHAIFAESAEYITQVKDQLVGDLRGQYPLHYSQLVSPLDRFFGYLANTVVTGNVTDLGVEYHQMFFEVYLVTLLSNPQTTRPLPVTNPAFREDFYNIFLSNNGQRVQNWVNGFQRAWNHTMRYLRALRALDHVLGAVLSQQSLSEQCQLSLMRMTECARCAGFSQDSAHTCQGLCLNVMRGCLVDHSDLVEPLRDFSEVLVTMKDKVELFNPYTQLILIRSNVLQLEGDFSLILTELSNLTTPIDSNTLNASAHCVAERLNLLSLLPDTVCKGEGISTENSNCWNGRGLGSYARSVFDFTRLQQLNNPEILLCSEPRPRFRRELRLLSYAERELRTLTGVCGIDDEDCLVVPPTTVYYNFDAIPLDDPTSTGGTPPVDDEDGSSRAGMPEDGLCQPVVHVTTVTPDTTTMPATVGTSSTATETPTTGAATVAASTTASAGAPSTATETPTTGAATVAASTTASAGAPSTATETPTTGAATVAAFTTASAGAPSTTTETRTTGAATTTTLTDQTTAATTVATRPTTSALPSSAPATTSRATTATETATGATTRATPAVQPTTRSAGPGGEITGSVATPPIHQTGPGGEGVETPSVSIAVDVDGERNDVVDVIGGIPDIIDERDRNGTLAAVSSSRNILCLAALTMLLGLLLATPLSITNNTA